MEVSRFCLRAGVTGVLWFYGRNMIMARVWSLVKWVRSLEGDLEGKGPRLILELSLV